MNVVLLSGGSGKRLWPLSNDVRSKQFIKLFERPPLVDATDALFNEEHESMVQRVYRQIRSVDPGAGITIATGKSQVSLLHNQLGEDVGISVEPCRRDTFPAIVLAALYLHEIQGVDLDEAVAICPVDPYVSEDFFVQVEKLCCYAQEGVAQLVLMGIEPTYPSEKYGYIIPADQQDVAKVALFKEKPSQEVAAECISRGGLWNSGVFAFKLSYVINRGHELLSFTDYDDLFSKYQSLKSISFDYAVVENEESIAVARFSGEWKDVGTWNTLSEVMHSEHIGNVVFDAYCHNTHIVNEMDVPVLALGLQDVIVAASAEGILVSDKSRSSYIKPFVDSISQDIKFAEKSWGSFKVIDVDDKSLTLKVTLKAAHGMNYHSHKMRDEVWTVLEGEGKTIVDGMEQRVRAGDVIAIAAGCKHTIYAITDLQLIEVQLGDDISVSDKEKHELDL